MDTPTTLLNTSINVPGLMVNLAGTYEVTLTADFSYSVPAFVMFYLTDLSAGGVQTPLLTTASSHNVTASDVVSTQRTTILPLAAGDTLIPTMEASVGGTLFVPLRGAQVTVTRIGD
jgi:hypothetical protein